jgi:hypothetical protein
MYSLRLRDNRAGKNNKSTLALVVNFRHLWLHFLDPSSNLVPRAIGYEIARVLAPDIYGADLSKVSDATW